MKNCKSNYQEILNDTAKSQGIENLENLNIEQIEKLFLKCINSYEEQNISLDSLSSIAGYLWMRVGNKTSDLGSALYATSELNFYLRKMLRSQTHMDSFENFLSDLRNYLASKKQ